MTAAPSPASIRRRPISALLSAACFAFLLATGACGDDDAAPGDDDGTVADAGLEADAGDQADSGPGADAGGSATAFAVATDFNTTGVASTVTIPGLDLTADAVDGVASTDPVLRRQGDRLFIVNRLGVDNVTVLDAARLSLVGQISTGSKSNPQDVAAVGNLLFVAALEVPAVLILDLDQPDAGVVDSIDVSALEPEDGNPNCHSIVPLGDRLVVVCGILDGFQPRGPGVVALIDPASRTLVDSAALTQVRPFGLVQVARLAGQDEVLVPTTDDFFDPTAGGCVERVAVEGDTIASAGCLIDNTDVGGFASGLAWDPAGERLWLTVTTSFDMDDFGPIGDLRSLSGRGEKTELVELAEEVRPMDVAVCPTGHLVLADATSGLRVLGPGAAEELTDAPLNIGLPPVTNGLVCF
jgi:hypothetical protein